MSFHFGKSKTSAKNILGFLFILVGFLFICESWSGHTYNSVLFGSTMWRSFNFSRIHDNSLFLFFHACVNKHQAKNKVRKKESKLLRNIVFVWKIRRKLRDWNPSYFEIS